MCSLAVHGSPGVITFPSSRGLGNCNRGTLGAQFESPSLGAKVEQHADRTDGTLLSNIMMVDLQIDLYSHRHFEATSSERHILWHDVHILWH